MSLMSIYADDELRCRTTLVTVIRRADAGLHRHDGHLLLGIPAGEASPPHAAVSWRGVTAGNGDPPGGEGRV